jgi:very-short-patch-repair endonuclease
MAKELRENMTTSEIILWDFLRRRNRGMKFYRQAPIDRFIVDFYCPRKKLVIEVDGGIHEQADNRESDILREEFLRKKGLRILRIRNAEIFHDLSAVWRRILQACGQKTHIPPSH